MNQRSRQVATNKIDAELIRCGGTMLKILSVSFLISLLLLSCRAIKTDPKDYTAYQARERSHAIAIFMDGTRDRSHSKKWRNSHVNRLRFLLSPKIKSLYVEGVGAGTFGKDAKYAVTTKERVMRAYRFLTENYEHGDSICLFGFSRGANQCRILSSLIYTIGIIDLDKIEKEKDKEKLLLDLYDLYISTEASVKKERIANYIKEWEGLHPWQKVTVISDSAMIELMGIWDTVEAFVIDDELEITTPMPQHLNQLYNVKKVFHATSLDDNRAFTYTPILATHKDVALHSGQDINSIVEEVWFNGSHKDVGGGVRRKKNDQLSGISLAWMLSRMKSYDIFRDTVFHTNIFGKAGNMRKGPFLKLTSPGDTLRGINKYFEAMDPNWNQHRIKVHRSVIDRLAKGVIPEFKLKKKGSARTDWYDWEPFAKCFTSDSLNKSVRKFDEKNCSCIEVVDDSPAN